MAAKLDLKIRKSGSVDYETWRRVLRQIVTGSGDHEQKVDSVLATVAQLPLERVHDKRWLETIVNFVPARDDGQPIPQPLTKQAEWMKLARRVGELDETIEGTFQLSSADVERIWRRLNDEKFAMRGFPTAYQEFILDFCEKTGKRFAGDVDTGIDVDEEFK